MVPEDQLYEGKTIRDIVIGLDKEVKHIKALLEGNGHQGLLRKIDDMEDDVSAHRVYFYLIGSAIAILSACALERLLG